MPTGISWTDETWNPVTGCSKVSAGCRWCYAEALSLRRGWSQKPWAERFAAENVVLHPDRLMTPLRWRKPRRVFVNSMSDLFHDEIPEDFIAQVFAVIATCPQHTFQVLTKRPAHMRDLLNYRQEQFIDRVNYFMAERADKYGWCLSEVEEWPLPNCWIGVSVENQHWADERIPLLLETPAAVRFLSVEPMLGPVDLSPWLHGLSWIIAGGESGPHYRPVDLDWLRDLRDQCQAAGVAYYLKQIGGRTPKAGGRELDGREWDEMPEDGRVYA